MSPALFAMLYGAVASVVTIWWLRRDARTGLPIWDAVGIVAAVVLGLMWPATVVGMAVPFFARVIDRIQESVFRD